MRNRIVMPPMATEAAREDGSLTQRHFDHYVPRARNGLALLILEHAYISLEGRRSLAQVGIHGDHVVPGLRALVESVHEAGAAIAFQITHAGSAAIGQLPVGPSKVRHPQGIEEPRELSADDLKRIIGEFVAAAKRAKKCGADAVEIHGAHGYLLSQFTSPITNRRTDGYGGDLEGRARFPLEVVRSVREAVGPEYLVMYRLGAQDQFPEPLPPVQGLDGGLSLEEGVRFASWLEEAGVDIIDVSGGLCGSRPAGRPPEGYFLPLQHEVKKAVKVPVIATGGIRSYEFGDEVVASGKADLVGIGRALLADPEWPSKALASLSKGGRHV